MNDPVLGELRSDPDRGECVLATIPYQDREIDLTVDPDDIQIEESLDLARDLVKSLPELEAKARAKATEKLLEKYNRHWRRSSRGRAGGGVEDVTDPELTSAEFAQKLILKALMVTGSMIEFCFDDNGLFAGHSIFVTSFDGTGFTDTDAELFG